MKLAALTIVSLLAAACGSHTPVTHVVPDWAEHEADATVDPSLGLPEEVTCARTGIRFVLVRPGTFFRVGEADSLRAEPDGSRSLQSVTITSPFYIGKYEVTQEQWLRFMDSNPSRHATGGAHPVNNVSWNQIQEFLRETQTRLPTEAEWEYVCRAGESAEGPETPPSLAWSYDQTVAYWHARGRERGPTATAKYSPVPVGLKEPNPWGVHDMLGNVEEWCSDWLGPYPASADPITDPRGPDTGEFRVFRGGSWWMSLDDLTATERSGQGPDSDSDEIGFRVAREP